MCRCLCCFPDLISFYLFIYFLQNHSLWYVLILIKYQLRLFAPRYRVDYFGYPFPRLWRFTKMWYQYLIIKLELCNTSKFNIYDINSKIFFTFERLHDDVIKWKHFPCYWPFVRGIHRSPVNSHTKASDAELWCFLWSAPV